MQDYNDPNFLLADVKSNKELYKLEKMKKNHRDALAAAIALAVIWGVTVLVAASRLM